MVIADHIYGYVEYAVPESGGVIVLRKRAGRWRTIFSGGGVIDSRTLAVARASALIRYEDAHEPREGRIAK